MHKSFEFGELRETTLPLLVHDPMRDAACKVRVF